MAFAHLRPKPAAAAPAPASSPAQSELFGGTPAPAAAPVVPPAPAADIAVERIVAAPVNVVATSSPAGNPVAAFVQGLGLPAVSTRGASRTRALSVSGEREGLFPIIRVNGKTGGYALPKDTPPDVARYLPNGTIPAVGVLLAYRLSLIAWSVGFDERSDESKAPSWSASIGGDSEAWDDAIKAAWNYQYTKKDDKASWDFDKSAIGHINPALDLLVYLPPGGGFVGGLVQLSTPGKIGSVSTSLESLEPYLPMADDGSPQAFAPFASSIAVKTDKKKSATWQWEEHSLSIQALAQTGECAALLRAFQTWGAALDEDTKDRFGKWVRGADAPLTDKGREAIARALSRGR